MKSLIKAIFVNTVSLALIGAGLIAMMIFGIVLLFAAAAGSQKSLGPVQGAVLVFDLNVNLTESAPATTPEEAIANALSGDETPRLSLHRVIQAMDRARNDPAISGLFLHGTLRTDGYSSGFAALKELREAIVDFQAAGKPVHAYLVSPAQRDYYLASAASNITLNPFGELPVLGLHSESPYFAAALQKYGVGIQVTRVGKFKSAVEPFLLDRMSDESREQTRALLGDLWSQYTTAVESSRGLPPGTLQQLADTRGILDAPAALSAKLVDKAAHLPEVFAELSALAVSKGATNVPGSFAQVDLRAYLAQDDAAQELAALGRSHPPHIALVCAEGEIVDGDISQPGLIAGDRLARELRALRRDPSVKAVVLRVNSPGGSVVASEVIAHELAALRAKKIPLVVSMGTVAASGGYWISAFSDRIFAEPNTITGSIGVFGLLPNVQKLAGDHGISFDGVGTGKFSGAETITRPKTPEELALVQTLVDDIYQKFLQKVADARHLKLEQVHEIAQGRVWSGEDAQQLGLVDELGGLQSALRHAAGAAKLGSDCEVIQYPKEKRLPDAIRELMEKSNPRPVASADPVTRLLADAKAELRVLRTLNDPRGVYARLPVTLRID